MKLKYILLSNLVLLCFLHLPVKGSPKPEPSIPLPLEETLGARMVKSIIEERHKGSRWLRCSNFILKVFTNRDNAFDKLQRTGSSGEGFKWTIHQYKDEVEALDYWSRTISEVQWVYARHFCKKAKSRHNIGNNTNCLYCANRIYGDKYTAQQTVANNGVISYNPSLDKYLRERRDKYPNATYDTFLEKCKPYHFLQFSTCEGILATLRYLECAFMNYDKNESIGNRKAIHENRRDCCDPTYDFIWRHDIIFNACHFGDYSKIAKCYKGGKQFLDYIRDGEFEYNACRYEEQPKRKPLVTLNKVKL